MPVFRIAPPNEMNPPVPGNVPFAPGRIPFLIFQRNDRFTIYRGPGGELLVNCKLAPMDDFDNFIFWLGVKEDQPLTK